MWSLKSLIMLKCESIELVYMQYNIKGNQALFSCSDIITLKMAGLDILFLCSVGQQARLCSYKIVLIKKKSVMLL